MSLLQRRKAGLTRSHISPSTSLLPELPHCSGFIYTVERHDTLHSIAKKFHCKVKDLLAVNPQIVKHAGHLFFKQRVCIPDAADIVPLAKQHHFGPKVLFVELLDATGNTLLVSNNFTHLPSRVFIRVVFDQPVSTTYFFFSPSRKFVPRSSFLLGTETADPPSRSVRFIWNVPSSIRGSLFIVGCNTRVCGSPEEIQVIRP